MQTEPYREGEHYKVDADTGCWIWLKSTDRSGYGIAQGRAHRKVYEALQGAIPEDHHLHHVCANKACVNPKHLRAVTHEEHMALEAPHGAKEETARALRAQGMTYADIAEILGCSTTTVHRLITGGDGGRAYREQRREHYRQLGRQYRESLRGVCVDCGGATGVRNGPKTNHANRCAQCAALVLRGIQEATEERRATIQRMWHSGSSMLSIATEVERTKGSLSWEMGVMRREGWDLPFRHAYQAHSRAA